MLIPGFAAFLSLSHEMCVALISGMLADITVTLGFGKICSGSEAAGFTLGFSFLGL